jgi:DNA-binding transcriptional LysR family regulator
LQLVQQGLGFAILPRLTANVQGAPQDVVFMQIADIALKRQLYLLTRSGSQPSPAARLLIESVVARAFQGKAV